MNSRTIAAAFRFLRVGAVQLSVHHQPARLSCSPPSARCAAPLARAMAAPVAHVWEELLPLCSWLGDGAAAGASAAACDDTTGATPAAREAARAVTPPCAEDDGDLTAATAAEPAADGPTTDDAPLPPAPSFRCLDARHRASCLRCVRRTRCCCAARAAAGAPLATRDTLTRAPTCCPLAALRRLPRAILRATTSSATWRRRTVRAGARTAAFRDPTLLSHFLTFRPRGCGDLSARACPSLHAAGEKKLRSLLTLTDEWGCTKARTALVRLQPAPPVGPCPRACRCTNAPHVSQRRALPSQPHARARRPPTARGRPDHTRRSAALPSHCSHAADSA